MADPLPANLIQQAGALAAQRTMIPIEVAAQTLTSLQKTFQEYQRRHEQTQDVGLKLGALQGTLAQAGLGLDINPQTGMPALKRLEMEELPVPLQMELGAKQLRAQAGLAKQDMLSRLLGGGPGMEGFTLESIGPTGPTFKPVVPGSAQREFIKDAEDAIAEITANQILLSSPEMNRQAEMGDPTVVKALAGYQSKSVEAATKLRNMLSKLGEADLGRLGSLHRNNATVFSAIQMELTRRAGSKSETPKEEKPSGAKKEGGKASDLNQRLDAFRQKKK